MAEKVGVVVGLLGTTVQDGVIYAGSGCEGRGPASVVAKPWAPRAGAGSSYGVAPVRRVVTTLGSLSESTFSIFLTLSALARLAMASVRGKRDVGPLLVGRARPETGWDRSR